MENFLRIYSDVGMPKVGSDDDASIKVADMTYRDMVRVSKWRKYDDPERYIEESSKASYLI